MTERSFGEPIVPEPVNAGYPEGEQTTKREWYDRLLDKHDLPLVLVGAILGCAVTVLFMVSVFILARFGA